MQKRGVRLGVVVAFVVALVGAAYFIYTEHQRGVGVIVQAREFDLARDRAVAALVDARSSMLAALVPGQGENYWLPRAAASLDAAKSELTTLKQGTLDGSALNDLEAAAAALDQASSTRDEVKRYLADDMRTQASRVVLSEGLESLTAATERIESARWTAQAQRDSDLAAGETLQAIVAGGLVAAALIVLGLLLPAPSQRTPAQVIESPVSEMSPPRVATSIAAGPPRAAAGVPTEKADARSETPATDISAGADDEGGAPPQRDRRKAPELRAAADLCTDFARLVDGQELPALLERSSKVLDATGFIVWLADPQGHQLRPSLAHGYTQQALAKLPTIPRHADNATAAAFRHSEMQIVRTNGMSPGAVVVPILGPGGCVGVMAAEVRHGREASESARAIARIVAAQLATLVGGAAAQATAESSPAAETARQIV
jgi:hypothetical protein